MSYSGYRTILRTVVRALWTGIWSFDQAFSEFDRAVRANIRLAWYEGMEEVGLLPADITVGEKIALERFIFQSTSRIGDFLLEVEENDKESGGLLRSHFKRVDIWARRWDEAKHLAMQMGGEDKKKEWVIDIRKESCEDCLRLDGKVKRMSVWEKYGIRPQGHNLACGGWECGCQWVDTDKPCTPGPLPKI